MTTQDVDRTFIAVNFEEVDLDNNDDKSLCRYEFLEIIARLAKIKYFEKGICHSVAASTEKMIQDSILPNTTEKMPWQEFRDNELWTLEVDDLFKANKSGMDQLIQISKSFNRETVHCSLEDAVDLVDGAGFSGTDAENKTSIAYSLSKSFIVDEMEDFDSYNMLKRGEFHEFIGRLAYLLYTKGDDAESKLPLVKKIEKLLGLLLRRYTGKDVQLPELDNDIPSDSDYEDDVVD